jgi:hypothetical protein
LTILSHYQSSVASAGLSLGENHFPTNSLTWRELLIGLATRLFNYGPDNLLLQPVSTQFPQGEHNNHWSIQLEKTEGNKSHSIQELRGHNNPQLRHHTAQTNIGYSDFPEDMDQSVDFPTGFRDRLGSAKEDRLGSRNHAGRLRGSGFSEVHRYAEVRQNSRECPATSSGGGWENGRVNNLPVRVSFTLHG